MKMNEFYEVDGCTDFIPVKLIEEHKHMTNTLEVELTETGYRTVVPHIYSFPKVNEHQKPVVPKFVAEWIEEIKETTDNLSWIWSVYPAEHKTKKWLEQNTEKFMRAWLDGFEIEQEKLYTVEIPSPNNEYSMNVLIRLPSSGKIALVALHKPNTSYLKNKEYHLTEAEIKQDFEWAFQFAKEVE